jgi:elongation factor P--beta-lysine ligase
MYPIWALLYFGWELEFGWKEEEDPRNAESKLKQKYAERHNNKLPALVKQ